MPELPEVEVHARRLDRWTRGRRVDAVHLPDPAAVRGTMSTRPSDAHPDGPALVARLVGTTSAGTVRRGKRLGWRFADPDAALLVHLGMTGRWVRRAAADEPPRFARIGLTFNGQTSWFLDSRRFGCVVPLDPATLDAAMTDGLGPDALDPLPPDELAARVGRGRTAIKHALMDQARLAGLGNIHAVEALWRARIHPGQPANRLEPAAWEALAAAIPAQLADVVRDEDGDDDVVYVSDGGDNPFAVYGREGEACPRCGAAVARAVTGGRATFWCPGCQPA